MPTLCHMLCVLLATNWNPQGNQLRRDLNEIVAQGKNWSIPAFWGPLIRYVAAPVLAIVYSFSYPSFYALRYDPLHILGFGVAHVALILIAVGFILPRWYDPLIPPGRRADGKIDLGPNVTANVAESEGETIEAGGKSRGDDANSAQVLDGTMGSDSERTNSNDKAAEGATKL